jgi:hypothetical protein
LRNCLVFSQSALALTDLNRFRKLLLWQPPAVTGLLGWSRVHRLLAALLAALLRRKRPPRLRVVDVVPWELAFALLTFADGSPPRNEKYDGLSGDRSDHIFLGAAMGMTGTGNRSVQLHDRIYDALDNKV